MFMPRTYIGVCSLVVCWCASVTNAQLQSQVTAPLRGGSSNYFENTGIGWGFRHQHSGGYLFFNNGGPGPIPPFGGFDPNSQASFGLAGQSGNFRWHFGVVAGQGSSQTLSSQSPSLVLPNGGAGVFSNTIQQPFVTGIVPVVGAHWISPVQERLWRLRYERMAEEYAREPIVEPADGALAPAQPLEPRTDDPPLILKGD